MFERIFEFLHPRSDERLAVAGDPAIHGVEPAESDIWMNIGDRVRHTLVLGTTRVDTQNPVRFDAALWPVSDGLRWIGIPVAVFQGILARLQWAYYKKGL